MLDFQFSEQQPIIMSTIYLPRRCITLNYTNVPEWGHKFNKYWAIADPIERQQLLLVYFKSVEVIEPACNHPFATIASKIDQSEYMISFLPGVNYNATSKKKLHHLRSCFIAEYLFSVFNFQCDDIHPPQKELKRKPSLAIHNVKDDSLEKKRNITLKSILGEEHWAIAMDKISLQARNKKRTESVVAAASAPPTISPSSIPARASLPRYIEASAVFPSHADRQTILSSTQAIISPSATTVATPSSSFSSVAERGTASSIIPRDGLQIDQLEQIIISPSTSSTASALTTPSSLLLSGKKKPTVSNLNSVETTLDFEINHHHDDHPSLSTPTNLTFSSPTNDTVRELNQSSLSASSNGNDAGIVENEEVQSTLLSPHQLQDQEFQAPRFGCIWSNTPSTRIHYLPHGKNRTRRSRQLGDLAKKLLLQLNSLADKDPNVA